MLEQIKERYIIFPDDLAPLPSNKPSPLPTPLSDNIGSPAVAARAMTPLPVETLDYGESLLLAEQKAVKAVAPVMPMKLIEPLNQASVAGQTGNTWGIEAIGADKTKYTGDGIVVAVLDTGIDRTHVAFEGLEIVERDFTGAGNGDNHGHGTHCAGTIAGRDVDGLRIGVARGIRKLLVGKVLGEEGSGGSDMLAEAIRWAVSEGAHIISMSLGVDFTDYVAKLIRQGVPAEMATSWALEGYRKNVTLFEKLCAYHKTAGEIGITQPVVIIAAAGNESRTDERPDFEIAVSPPAVADGVISVAATGKDGEQYITAPFSNVGAILSGPGMDVSSAKAGGGTVAWDGTSMATPHVAGVAALWAQYLLQNGQFTTLNLTSRLIAACDTKGYGNGSSRARHGAGLVQVP